jgi:uncharacterized protein YgiM (DUF1202 family)
MVRRRFRPLIAFAAVIVAAGSVTAAGLTFTAHTVSQTVAELPQVKQRVLPSYVVRLPVAKAADLDISKSAAVKPQVRIPVTLPEVPVVAQVTTQVPAAGTNVRLTAEVTPLSSDTVGPPTTRGDAYVALSDVSMRAGPSRTYGRIGTIAGGTAVNVTGEDGGWLKVSLAEGSGWVYQRYLAPAGREVADGETGAAPF